MNAAALEAINRARQDYARARAEEDLHQKFRAYVSAGRNVLDAAMADPEDPKVKQAMQALLTGVKPQ